MFVKLFCVAVLKLILFGSEFNLKNIVQNMYGVHNKNRNRSSSISYVNITFNYSNPVLAEKTFMLRV